MEIESYLPLFPGFYNTQFEADESSEIEEGYTYDDYEWDYENYHKEVIVACCEAIQDRLGGIHISVEIKKPELSSPKYYNFTNDSINVTYVLDEGVFNRIRRMLIENINPFEDYLHEKYSSRPGFISYYSTDPVEWIDNLNHTHKFGASIGFLLMHLDDYWPEDLAMSVQDADIYITGTLKQKEEF